MPTHREAAEADLKAALNILDQRCTCYQDTWMPSVYRIYGHDCPHALEGDAMMGAFEHAWEEQEAHVDTRYHYLANVGKDNDAHVTTYEWSQIPF